MCCFGTYSLTSKEKFIPFGLLRKTSRGWRINPPNHLQVVPWHYHGNGSRLLQMIWWIIIATAVVLRWPRKKCNFTSIIMIVQRYYLQMIWWIISISKYVFISRSCQTLFHFKEKQGSFTASPFAYEQFFHRYLIFWYVLASFCCYDE